MANNRKEYPAVIVDTEGTVEVFDGERSVVLTHEDYELVKASGISPFDRIFRRQRPVKPIVVSGEDLKFLDL